LFNRYIVYSRMLLVNRKRKKIIDQLEQWKGSP